MHAQEISTAGPSPSTNPGVIGGSTDLKKGHFHRTSKKCGKCALRCKQTVFIPLGGKWFCQSFKLDGSILVMDKYWVVRIAPAKDNVEPSIPS